MTSHRTLDALLHNGPAIGICAEVPALFSTGVAVRRIDGTALTSTPAIVDALAAAWDFPSHFGRNRDALDDCMRDLPVNLATAEGTATSGYLTIITNADGLLPHHADDLEWFADSIGFWQAHYRDAGQRFAFLLASEVPNAMVDRINAAGGHCAVVRGRG